jgi:hypothetical protein
MIVGADGQPDYDHLLSVAGVPAGARGPAPGYPYPPPGYYPPPQYGPPALPPAPAQRHVVREQPTKSRDFPVGFTMMNVQPNVPVEIEVKPQVLFRGKRLAVASSIAKEFMIIDIKVGKNSQLAATGEMSAEAFSSTAVGTQMELDSAQPGITITIRVRNISAGPVNFLAVLYGAVME